VGKIAENLVVRAVRFDDQDDVLDAGGQGPVRVGAGTETIGVEDVIGRGDEIGAGRERCDGDDAMARLVTSSTPMVSVSAPTLADPCRPASGAGA